MNKPIAIQVGNDCELGFKPMLEDGTLIPPSSLSDIKVEIGSYSNKTEFEYEISGDYIVVQLPADQEQAVYNIYFSAKIGDRSITDNRTHVFSRVPFGMGVPYEHLNMDLYFIGASDEETQEIREELEAAITQANQAKAAADAAAAEYARKVAGIDGLAKESNATANKNEILSAISTGGGGITPEQYNALAKSEQSEAILAKATIAANEATSAATRIPTLQTALQGSNQSANLSNIEYLVGNTAKSSDLQTANAKLTALQTQVGEFEDGESAASTLGDVAAVLEAIEEGGIPVVEQPATSAQAEEIKTLIGYTISEIDAL